MAARKEPEVTIWIARSSGIVKADGQVYRYTRNVTRVRAGHPLLRAVPDKFVPLSLDFDAQQPVA